MLEILSDVGKDPKDEIRSPKLRMSREKEAEIRRCSCIVCVWGPFNVLYPTLSYKIDGNTDQATFTPHIRRGWHTKGC